MIGIFGGTFDPIHFGHLRPALDMLQGLPLQEIRFVPLRTAVHRMQPVATAAQRLAMVRAAVEGQPGFVADPCELQRTGSSYSYDTLVSLRAQFGPQLPICLLTGLDAFAELPTWYRWEDIAGMAHLVIMRRPGADAVTDPELRRWMEPRLATDPAALAQVPGGLILCRDVTQLDISATAIRSQVAQGLSPRFLLPASVLAFIEREGLYRLQALTIDLNDP
ncbi:nicotinate-nucleotide adenylyltransferase [Candidatus Thiosymbion oneisti]|uniref:nicotinate-nucleotide adenylyltransferase n=1 Tax=Candidatus Thiosymbion oneisti TaxID=589554 RepID=UPI000B1C91A3|nr:nicotinate-nucleotide adenylyltransferase [Candidatus Thiosymbion oneisti]